MCDVCVSFKLLYDPHEETHQTHKKGAYFLSSRILEFAAAAKSLQSSPTLYDPIDGSPQVAPSLGFSRQEYWNGLHFLLQCMKVKSESEVAQSRPHELQPTRLLHPWDFPGKSTGVGCHCLLQFQSLMRSKWKSQTECFKNENSPVIRKVDIQPHAFGCQTQWNNT